MYDYLNFDFITKYFNTMLTKIIYIVKQNKIKCNFETLETFIY